MFCVIIPGSVHQYVSQYPVNYMTDFLDVNRKTYDIFKLDNSNLYTSPEIHPEISLNKDSLEINLENKKIRRSISSIVNKMNVDGQMKSKDKMKRKIVL